MKDDIRRAFDGITEEPHPALRASLRARLAGGPVRSTSPVWRFAAVAAVVAIVALAGYAGYSSLTRPSGGGGTGLAGTPAPSPAGTSTAVASPSPEASPSPSASPTPAFACNDLSGGTAGATAEVTDVRVGTAAGYDRLVIQFSGPVPAYTISRQGNPDFTADASGQQYTLQGSSGVRIVVHGASAMSPTWSTDVKPNYPELKEARQTGAFEAVFSWGVGLADSQGGCERALVLTAPDRLVIDFQQP